MEGGEQRPPVWQLIAVAAAELDSPFNSAQVLEWFRERYPDVPEGTIRSQLAALAGNTRGYLTHPVYSRRPPILWRVERGTYEPYDSARHGEPTLTDEEIEDLEGAPEARQPVWRLVEQASRELPAPFSVPDVLDWFADSHPEIPTTTIRSQVTTLAGNSVAYLSNPVYSQRSPVLWRVGRGVYEPYERATHGEVGTQDGPGGDRHADEEEALEAAQEFLLEQYLEQFLFDNWDRIEFGRQLGLWSPDDRSPRQFDTRAAGRIDFLCKDVDSDALVVVELKRGAPADSVVGQTLRYMGWLRENIARPEQRVEGLIIAADSDERLRFATLPAPALGVLLYRISFSLEHPA